MIKTIVNENEQMKRGKFELTPEMMIKNSKHYLQSQYQIHLRNVVEQNNSIKKLSDKQLIQQYLEIRFKRPNWPKQFTVRKKKKKKF